MSRFLDEAKQIIRAKSISSGGTEALVRFFAPLFESSGDRKSVV